MLDGWRVSFIYLVVSRDSSILLFFPRLFALISNQLAALPYFLPSTVVFPLQTTGSPLKPLPEETLIGTHCPQPLPDRARYPWSSEFSSICFPNWPFMGYEIMDQGVLSIACYHISFWQDLLLTVPKVLIHIFVLFLTYVLPTRTNSDRA